VSYLPPHDVATVQPKTFPILFSGWTKSLWRLFLRNRGFPTASAKKVTWSCLDILKVSRMYQSRLMVKIVSPFTIPRLAVFKGKSQERA